MTSFRTSYESQSVRQSKTASHKKWKLINYSSYDHQSFSEGL